MDASCKYDRRAFLLKKVPPGYGKEHLQDHLEGVLDKDIERIRQNPCKADIFLVIFEEPVTDFKDSNKQLRGTDPPLNKLVLEPLQFESAVFLQGIDFDNVTEQLLTDCIQVTYADGEEVITSYKHNLQHGVVVVRFHRADVAVAEKMLAGGQLKLKPLPFEKPDYIVPSEPYFEAFHAIIFNSLYVPKRLDSEAAQSKNGAPKIEGMQEGFLFQAKNEYPAVDPQGNHNKTPGLQIEKACGLMFNSSKGFSKVQIPGEDLPQMERLQGTERAHIDTIPLTTTEENNMVLGSLEKKREDKLGSSKDKKLGGLSFQQNIQSENIGAQAQPKPCPGNLRARRGGHSALFTGATRSSSIKSSQESNLGGTQSSNKESSSVSTENVTVSFKQFSDHDKETRNDFNDYGKNQSSEAIHVKGIHEKEIVKDSGCVSIENTPEERKEKKHFGSSVEKQSAIQTKEIGISKLKADLLFPHFSSDTCNVYYDSIKGKIIINGEKEDVESKQLQLMTEITKIQEQQLDLSRECFELFQNTQGKQYLDEKTPLCKWEIRDEKLFVLSLQPESLKRSITDLKLQLNAKETVDISNMEGKKVEYAILKCERDFLVKMKADNNKLFICGLKDDVQLARKHMSGIIEVDKEIQKTFMKKGYEALFYQKHLKDKVLVLRSSDVKVEQNFVPEPPTYSVTLSGKSVEVEKVFAQISKLSDFLECHEWKLQEEDFEEDGLWLISKSLEELKVKFDSFQIEHQCLIFMNIPKPKEKSETSQRMTFSSKPKGATKQRARQVEKPSLPQKAKHILFSGVARPECKVHVKSYGDVTKEQSDISVCVLTERKDLRRTRVGQAFNSQCPNLWRELKDKIDANPSDSVIVTSTANGNVACQSIIHVVLKPWDPNNSQNCETEFRQIIAKVLATADNTLQAKSISFPVMGCGRAFKFPPSVVAKAMLESISDHLQSAKGSLANIVLLAPDAELSREIEKCKNQQGLSLIQGEPSGSGQLNASKGLDDSEEKQAKNDDDDDDDDESEEEEEEDGADERNDSWKLKLDQFSSSTVGIMATTDCSQLWKKLKAIIRDYCLYTDYFNQEQIERWPKSIRGQIKSEAEKYCVIVEFSKHPSTKSPGVVIKGKKEDVTNMKMFIQLEFQKLTQFLPQVRLNSPKAPKRGTTDFLKYAADSDEPFPSYWNQTTSWLKKKMNNIRGKKETDLLKNVDDKTFKSIKNLVEKTWEVQKVGHGSDGQFPYRHQQLLVQSVQRVENHTLYEKYSLARKHLFRRCTLCPDIGKLSGSQGRVKTTEILDSHMKSELYYEINEHYLFHGFKGEFQKTIAQYGLDAKVGSSGGMFGRGVYFAESSTKADQYSDGKTQRTPPGTKLTMVLARVLLGSVYLCDHNHPTVQSKGAEKLKRPPCTSCLQDRCSCGKPQFDSVMGDGKWLFREFIVYESAHCYPEYIITYIRQ